MFESDRVTLVCAGIWHIRACEVLHRRLPAFNRLPGPRERGLIEGHHSNAVIRKSGTPLHSSQNRSSCCSDR
jgi:hypothetical protein